MNKRIHYYENWPTNRPRLHLNLVIQRHLSQAERDVNRFIEFCFAESSGAPIRQAPFHRDLQAFLNSHPKALIELPRDHGKSTQVCGRLVWELGRNPGLRVKLVCSTDSLAAERTRFLREAIATNERVQWVFPHLRPARPWAANAFTIQRPANVIGPSVAAFGIGSGSTGARADVLVCDDIVDVAAVHSQAERDRVSSYFTDNLLNLLEPTGRFWGLFTPWHLDDCNARLKKCGAFAAFRRAIGPNLESLWPEKWPTQKLAERRAEIGSASFARGYHLTPIDDTQLAIRRDWIRFHDAPTVQYDHVILAIDPASTGKSDATAFVVLGRVGRTIDCLSAVPFRVTGAELESYLDDFDRVWRPDVIVFESNGAFEAVRSILTANTRFGPKLRGVVQSRAKELRVQALAVLVEKGDFRLGRSQHELYHEMTTFP